MSTRRDLAIVLAIAAVAHFTYFALRFGSFYFPDSFTYLNPAIAMLHGHGFVSGQPPQAETIRTPGYPLLLMLFGARTVPVIVLQHLICVALAGALYLLVLHRLRSRFAACIAATLFALDTPTIHIANKLLTETLFTALLFAVFVLVLEERPRFVAIAILLGVMVLVRPIAMFLFVVVALRIPRRKFVPFMMLSLALPLGWGMRNFAETGVFTVSSVGNINLLAQRAAGALAIEDDGDDFRSDLTDEQRGLVEDADAFIERKLHIDNAEELPVAVRAGGYKTYAAHVIAQHPIAFAQLTIRGLLVNLFDSDWLALLPVTLLYPTIVELTAGVLPVVTFVLGIIGLAALWHRDRLLGAAIFLTAAYFLFISAGAEAEYRFRVPVVPQLAIAAAAGLDAVRRAVTSR